MFDSLTISDARSILWLKRVFVVVIVVFLAIGMVSAHRAYFQIRSLELTAPDLLSDGSVCEASVVSSGRTMCDVTIQLIQGAHSEKILQLHVNGNELGFFDPRAQHGSASGILTRETLSSFQPGSARLRAVAIGRHQWFRLPPPTVHELDVVIVKQSGR